MKDYEFPIRVWFYANIAYCSVPMPDDFDTTDKEATAKYIRDNWSKVNFEKPDPMYSDILFMDEDGEINEDEEW